MASGWNLLVLLQCIGVVMGVVVRRYIDILTIIINFPYSTCIFSSFFGSSIPTSLFILNIYIFVLVYVIFVQHIAHITQRTFEFVQKIEITQYNDLIISIFK